MAADLFGESVDESYNRSQLTDDFLAEADVPDGDAQPKPRQQQAQQPSQPKPQPSRSFVPEGYEAPSVVANKRDGLIRRYKALDAKLGKARNTAAADNPYSYTADDGSVQFDNMAYNDDMRQLGSIKMEIDQLNEKLRDSRDTAQSSQQSVKQYARDFFLRAESRIPQHQREAAKKAYAGYYSDLVRINHFENPANLTTEALERALGNIFRAAVGDAVLAQQGNERPRSKTPGTHEDDAPTADEGADEFEGWPEESKRMWASFEKAEAARGGTLADKAKQRQGGSR